MPEIKKNEDGTVEIKYETGETFTGDPIEVMNKMGEAHVSTKRWAQNIKAENENLKAQHLNPPAPPPPVAPVGNPDELALQSYLLDQQAKALGFKNGDEYKQRLEYINGVTEQQANNQVAESFMLACPEFPSTPDSVDKLTKKVEDMRWDYNQQSLMAAHLMCVREGAYKPLTPEEVNASWAQNMQRDSGTAPQGRTVPPTPPPGGAPGHADQTNPWAMSTDELRKKVLEGGGLGKALLEMPTGGSLS